MRVAAILAGLTLGTATVQSIAHPMPRDTRQQELFWAHRCGEDNVGQVKACIRRAVIHWAPTADTATAFYVADRETHFNPNICNSQGSGACGLFQFMPGTFCATPYCGQDVFSAKVNALAFAWGWTHLGPSHWGM